MSSPSTFECFGLVIHGLDWERVREKIEQSVSRNEKTWIVTANPEILLHAKQDANYWQKLRQADLRLVDGFGLKLIGWLSGSAPQRLTGIALAEHLLGLAQEKNWLVAFVGGKQGSADKAAWEMRKRFPKLRITIEEGGTVSDDGNGDAANEEALQRLTLAAPDILLIAFGHPKQETWIVRHLEEFPSIKIAVGVGGTFDFWSGTVKRSPSWLRGIGMEWLWRLFQEPRRAKRIWNAVIVFPIVVLLDKVRKH